MLKTAKSKVSIYEYIVGTIGLILFVWWLLIRLDIAPNTDLYWAASYQVIAVFGWVFALYLSKRWGGYKSVMGKAILGFAIGLMLQNIGQTVFSYYNLVLQVEIPYPSLADIGYFGSIPFYIYGILYLAKASGVVVSLTSFGKKASALLIPLAMLLISYLSFLNHYEADWSSPLRMFLDFGYPLGQAVYVSIAILTFFLSRGVLGGLMKPKIMFVLAALVVQYLADYNFLYQSIGLTWVNGGYGDLIYMAAYLLMALSLARFRTDLLTNSAQ